MTATFPSSFPKRSSWTRHERDAYRPTVDAVGQDHCSFVRQFHELGLRMIKAQGAIFGWVSDSGRVLAAMEG
jgi:hypothetical protein